MFLDSPRRNPAPENVISFSRSNPNLSLSQIGFQFYLSKYKVREILKSKMVEEGKLS